MPPEVPALGPLDVVSAALDHEDVLDGRLAGSERCVDRGLEREDLAFAPPAVGGDHELGARIVDARPEALRAEAAEDDRVHGADARYGQHCDHCFRDHREVDRDAVAGVDAEAGEQIGRPLDLGGQLGVSDGPAVARLALPVDGDTVAVAGQDVSIEAVVRHVEFAVVEPGRERRIGPVEGLGERLVPVQESACLVGPEAEPVRCGLLVQVGAGHSLGGELVTGRKASFFVQQVVDCVAHGGVFSLLCDAGSERVVARLLQTLPSAGDPIIGDLRNQLIGVH